MKRLRSRPVAWYISVASLTILLALKVDDWRRQIVAGPVARTHLVAVESLPPGSSLSIAPNVYASELAWSPDSRLLAVPTYGDGVKLYDGQTGKLIRALGEEAGYWPDVAWSFDGGMLATSDYETTAENPADGQDVTRIWSADGTQQAAIPGSLIAWANRSNHILIAPYDRGELADLWQVWEVTADGQTLLQSEFERRHWRVAISPDDQWVVTVNGTSDADAKLIVWEFASRRVVAELVSADMSDVDSLAWSPDGAWLAALYYYDCPLDLCARLEVWDTATWQSYKTFGRLPRTARTISWSADSRWIAAGVSPTRFSLTLYPLDEQQMIRELNHPLTEHDIVRWSPDGQKLATTNFDSFEYVVTIWQAEALLP